MSSKKSGEKGSRLLQILSHILFIIFVTTVVLTVAPNVCENIGLQCKNFGLFNQQLIIIDFPFYVESFADLLETIFL